MRQQWLNSTGEMSLDSSMGGDEDDGSTPRRPALDIITDDVPMLSSNSATLPASDSRSILRLREVLRREQRQVL